MDSAVVWWGRGGTYKMASAWLREVGTSRKVDVQPSGWPKVEGGRRALLGGDVRQGDAGGVHRAYCEDPDDDEGEPGGEGDNDGVRTGPGLVVLDDIET